MSEKESFLAALDKAGAGDETLLATGPDPAGAAVTLYTTGGNDDFNVGGGPDSGYDLTVDSRPLGGGASTAVLGGGRRERDGHDRQRTVGAGQRRGGSPLHRQEAEHHHLPRRGGGLHRPGGRLSRGGGAESN